MCAVSAIIGSWQDPGQGQIGFTPTFPSPSLALQMLDVIKRLDGVDKRLGQLECKVDKATKSKFIRKLKRRAKK